MIEKSMVTIRFVILFCLLPLLVASCAEQFADTPSFTLTSPDTAVKNTLTSEETATESLEETEITVPTETIIEPTKEPTAIDPVLSTEIPLIGIGIGEAEMVAKTKAHLATRLAVSEGEITVVSVEAVTWRDASLGCPTMGRMYSQVLTPGYQIILEVNGTQYDYRTDTLGHFLLCDK
jgi:hypothetical protein